MPTFLQKGVIFSWSLYHDHNRSKGDSSKPNIRPSVHQKLPPPLNNRPYLLLRRMYIRRIPDREEQTHSTSTEEHNTGEATGRCQQNCGILNETQRRTCTPTSLSSTPSVSFCHLSDPHDPTRHSADSSQHKAKTDIKPGRLTNHLSLI